MGIRGQDFVTETIETASQDMVAVTLVDVSTPAAAAAPVARVNSRDVITDPALEREVDLEVAGRRWQLQAQPTSRSRRRCSRGKVS